MVWREFFIDIPFNRFNVDIDFKPCLFNENCWYNFELCLLAQELSTHIVYFFGSNNTRIVVANKNSLIFIFFGSIFRWKPKQLIALIYIRKQYRCYLYTVRMIRYLATTRFYLAENLFTNWYSFENRVLFRLIPNLISRCSICSVPMFKVLHFCIQFSCCCFFVVFMIFLRWNWFLYHWESEIETHTQHRCLAESESGFES